MTLDLSALNLYVAGLAKSLYTRGFDLPAGPSAQRTARDRVRFEITGTLSEPRSELHIDEVWAPAGERFLREAYAYDLIDHANQRRRAFHLHDSFLPERLGVTAHEHCEEVLGQPRCEHYLGRELPNGYVGIDLLMAAWLEPGPLGCDALHCLD